MSNYVEKFFLTKPKNGNIIITINSKKGQIKNDKNNFIYHNFFNRKKNNHKKISTKDKERNFKIIHVFIFVEKINPP